MSENKLTLAPNFSIPAVDYAGQGNAILGIRDAGKTYTAMKAAEELLDNKIPIIVYDPVGVWKNLKIGTGKHKGYPIVVAGGEGSDIRLNVNNACDIVRAAMKENVSLVIDLYSPELINKSSWIRIVQETVDLLMYENKECGLRHIFIEEAAEFIPQRLNQQHFKVYASIERLARMGRNARLGYTLINQRAEEVNKAILEISAFSLLHKQVGKNSLKSIQQWMELLQVENSKEIIQSLPALKQGECWVIGMNSKPHKIKISERKTFHPDPKKNIDIKQVSMLKLDVSSFVEKLNKQLAKPADKIQDKKAPVPVDTTKYDIEIAGLKNKIKSQEDYIAEMERVMKVYEERDIDLSEVLNQVAENLTDNWKAPKRKIIVPTIPKNTNIEFHQIGKNLPKNGIKSPNSATNVQKKETNVQKSEYSSEGKKLGKCSLAILEFLASFPERAWTKAQIGIATSYSPGSGGFNNALSELTSAGLILRGERIQINPDTNVSSYLGDFTSKEYSIETFKSKLSKCEREIYEVLLSHPYDIFKKEGLAEATFSQYSSTSGGFNNALSTLNTLELIKRQGGQIQLNPELLEI